MMTDAERKARAAERAATLPPGEYHAYNNSVATMQGKVIECESHWDACLVLLAIGREG
jgi:hypothetical protein